MTQLRPAARQLSPTLQELSKLAPDLKALFQNLDPLFDVAKAGPAARPRPSSTSCTRCWPTSTRRCASSTRRSIGLGQYKNELSSFFANVAAATQATTQEGNARVHYLRTTNPVNPENLAVYPIRIGTNRPNPYTFPDAFKNLATGPAVLRDAPVRRRARCRRSSPSRSRACPSIRCR